MPKISVIIPVYNVEKYLSKCLDSVINQSLKEIEIIVVNDGSTDKSQSIIDEYIKKDNRIISIMQENGRQGKARNTGLYRSKGEYISFIDSDDYIEKDMLLKMYNNAKENNSEIVICSYNIVYPNKIISEKIDHELLKSTENNEPLKLLNAISPCTRIYKRKFLIDNNIIFKEKVYYEDVAFALKNISLANYITYVNEPLYNYLKREGSTMTSTNLSKNLDIIDAFEDTVNFFRKHEIYEKFYNEIEFLAIDELFISAIVRAIRSEYKIKEKARNIDELLKYFKTNFKTFKTNKYIIKLEKNRKIVFYLLIAKQYWIIDLVFKIKNKQNI